MGRRIQYGQTNIASGNDRIAIQVGHIGGGQVDDSEPDLEPADDDGRVVNIRSGNARVGMQVDTIEGGLTL
jgi:hypothetical protein